jgi:hypothetical protein
MKIIIVSMVKERESLSRYSDGMDGRGLITGRSKFFFLLHSV